MSFQVASLHVPLTLDDQLTRELGRADRSMSGFRDNTERSARSIGATFTHLAGLAAGIGAALGSAASVNAALQFDRSMSNVRSVIGGTREEMGRLSREILAIGSASRAGPQAVADAYYDIVSGVQDATAHMAILNTSIAVSEAGQANLTTTTSGLVAVMNAYGLSADRAAYVGDVFTRTVQVGVGTMDSFVAAMSPIAGLMNQAGVSFEEFGAVTAWMTAQGVGAAEAATQQRAAITALIRPSSAMQAALRRLGYESGVAAIQQRGFAGALRELASITPGGALGMAEMLGSVHALNAALIITNPEAAAFFEIYQSGMEGATEVARAFQLDGPAAQFDLFRARLEGLGITVGNMLLPVLGEVSRIASLVVQKIIDKAPEILATLGTWFEWVPGLLDGLSEDIRADLAILGEGLSKFMEDGWTQEMTNAVERIFTNIGQTIARLGVGLIESFKDALRDLDIPQPVRDAVEFLLGPLERGLRAMTELDWGKLVILGTAIAALSGGVKLLSSGINLLLKAAAFELFVNFLTQLQEVVDAIEEGNWGEVIRNVGEALIVLAGALLAVKVAGAFMGAGGLGGLLFGAGGTVVGGAVAQGAGAVAGGAGVQAARGLVPRAIGALGAVAPMAGLLGIGGAFLAGTYALSEATFGADWNPEPTVVRQLAPGEELPVRDPQIAALQEEINRALERGGGPISPEAAALLRGDLVPHAQEVAPSPVPRLGAAAPRRPDYTLADALGGDDFLDVPTGTIPLTIPPEDRAMIEQGLVVPAEQFGLLMTGVDLTPTAADTITTGVDLTPTAAAIIARGINLNVPANMGQIIGEADDWAALVAGAGQPRRGAAGGGIGMRDSGGPGLAGRPYLIGRGAQPELFVPDTNGYFYPRGAYGGGEMVVPVTLTLDGQVLYRRILRQRDYVNGRGW